MKMIELFECILRKKSKSAMINAALSSERPEASKRELDNFVLKMIDSIRANRRREARAIVLCLVMADGAAAVARMRKAGCLRASRYHFKTGCLEEIIKVILDARSKVEIPSNFVDYLRSVEALYDIAPALYRKHEEILSLLRPRKEISLKTLIAIANELFVIEDYRDKKRGLIDKYSREDIAEAVSFLISIMKECIGIRPEYIALTDESAVNEGNQYEKIIMNAIDIIKFREAETLIDGLPYKAVRVENAVIVSSIDPDIEKSVRLGYIQTELQGLVRMRALAEMKKQHKTLSLRDVVKRCFEEGFGKMIKIHENPFRRFVFAMPTDLEFFDIFFGGNSLFEEEWVSVMLLSVEDFEKEVDRIIMITDNISSLDIFKVQRLFRLVGYIYQQKLEEIEDCRERNLLKLRSVIPVFRRDQLITIIEMVLPQKSEEIINLLTLEEDRQYIDIQYTPFIKIGSNYMIPPRIVAESNLVRNLICAHNLRPKLMSGNDPMEREVIKALEIQGFKVRSRFSAKLRGKKYETDIFAWREGVLFIFECKNAYLPCSVHEMRNSYNHIVAAGEQLDIRLDLLRDKACQETLFGSLGWDVAPTDRVFTGIIIANRVFHGSRQGIHPVRQAHELINVLLRGEISMNKDTYSFWMSDEFQVVDLVNYLIGGSIASDQLAEMLPTARAVKLGDISLVFESYILDLNIAGANLMNRYPAKPRP